MAEQRHEHVDAVTGTATTGHEWDGIHELNTPLPRWWLWMFYATIVWAVGYWIVYPSWPLIIGYTHGRVRLALARRGRRPTSTRCKAQRGPMVDKLADASLQRDRERPATARLRARAGRAPAFGDNCAPCHGAGGGGAKGYPNLNDDDWLWGGKLDDIAADHPPRRALGRRQDPRRAQMPAFGRDGILKRAEIDDVADYVRSLVRPAGRRQAPISRPARRSSPTIAPSVMATTARATASSARPT